VASARAPALGRLRCGRPPACHQPGAPTTKERPPPATARRDAAARALPRARRLGRRAARAGGVRRRARPRGGARRLRRAPLLLLRSAAIAARTSSPLPARESVSKGGPSHTGTRPAAGSSPCGPRVRCGRRRRERRDLVRRVRAGARADVALHLRRGEGDARPRRLHRRRRRRTPPPPPPPTAVTVAVATAPSFATGTAVATAIAVATTFR
jgi:hypothetical protein